jgi:hemerythrin
MIGILGTDTQELIETINHNLSSKHNNKRFQRKVSSAALDSEALPQFEQLANEKSQALLEELDHWLSQHEAKHDEDSQYVSLGIYFYQKDSNGELP